MKHTTFRLLPVLAGILLASPAMAEDAGGGLPQLDSSTYASQLFWLFLCFTVLYVVMSRLSLPRVGETLDLRRVKKDSDLHQAGAWNEEAEKVKKEYEAFLVRTQQTAAATVTTAERAVSGRIAEEQGKFADNARKRLAAAEQNIVKAKAEALHSLADISADIAAGMVEKIADVQVSKADAKKAVTAAMQEG